jgi:hypothetical protein
MQVNYGTPSHHALASQCLIRARGAGRAHEQGIGQPPRHLQVSDAVKDHGEHQHGPERPEDGPGDADDGLLVAHQAVPPGQNVEELAIAPQAAPIILLGAARLR